MTHDKKQPPDTFHRSPNAYKPDWNYKPIEGLKDTVERLHSKGRLRSAMDEIFKALDMHPDHSQALMLAMIVAGESRMGRLEAEEPLTNTYFFDRRIDPIFTVCSHNKCGGSTWVSINCILDDYITGMSIVTNPNGLQCHDCGYVVCRECLRSLDSEICPNCGQSKLRVPVYPTGRAPVQMKRHSQPILRIIIFSEGSVPPDDKQIKDVLQDYSPDAIEQNVQIETIPQPSWHDDMTMIVYSSIRSKESRGDLPPGSSGSTETLELYDRHGIRFLIAKIMQPTDEEMREDAESQAKIKSIVESAFLAVQKEMEEKRERPSNVEPDKPEETPEVPEPAGVIERYLRRCADCGVCCLMTGVNLIFTPGAQEHDHRWQVCQESFVIEKYFDGSELAYLRQLDSMFEALPGLVRTGAIARLIWAECLERLAQLRGKIPSDPVEAHIYKAQLFYQIDLHDLAAIEYEEAVHLQPDNMSYRDQMAVQYLLSDNVQKAEAAWEELLQLDPGYEHGRKNYVAAISQLIDKYPGDKLRYHRKLVELEPENQAWLRDLGVTCQEAELWEEAIKYLKDAIKYATQPLDTNSVTDFKGKVKDRIATCFVKLGQTEEAGKYLSEAYVEGEWNESQKNDLLVELYRLQPQNQTWLRDLGLAIFKAGLFQAALTHLEDALRYAVHPSDAKTVDDFKGRVKERIAACCMRLGRYQNAVQYLTEALNQAEWNVLEKLNVLSALENAQSVINALEEVSPAMRRTLSNHLERISQSLRQDEVYIRSKADYDILLQPRMFSITQAAIMKLWQQSTRDGKHHFEAHHLEDALLIVSTIPTWQPWEGISYFYPDYIGFLDAQLRLNPFTQGAKILAHWIFCFSDDKEAIHLTHMPKNGIFIHAHDFLTDADKSRIGIALSARPPRKTQIEVPNLWGTGDTEPFVVQNDPDVRKILSQIPEQEFPYQFRGYLGHPNPRVRLETLQMAGELGKGLTDQGMIDLLVDPEPEVRSKAAGMLWSSLPAVKFAIRCLNVEDGGSNAINISTRSKMSPEQARTGINALAQTAPSVKEREQFEVWFEEIWQSEV